MSVIFKERHYDQLLIFIKNFTAVILLLIVLISSFNFISNKKLELLKNRLDILNKEELKYQQLIDNSVNKNYKSSLKKRSILLVKLARAAENIIFNSIHFKDSKIKLNAVSLEQKMIFKLIENLKADKKFTDLKLLKINQKDKFYFELEMKSID